MGNRVAPQRDAGLAAQGFLSVLRGLFDGGRHFVGFAVAARDAAPAIADDHQRVEAESAAALDHRGAPADFDHPVFEAVLTLFSFSGHRYGIPSLPGPPLL